MTPQAESVLESFRSTGAYLKGHFRLTSGLHSAEYLQSALVLQHPAIAERFGQYLAGKFRELGLGDINLVASPALGGLIIGHEVARALGTRFLFTERDPATGKMTLRRGFKLPALVGPQFGRARRDAEAGKIGRSRKVLEIELPDGALNSKPELGLVVRRPRQQKPRLGIEEEA